MAVWIPLGPWPIDGGSLAVLPGSHRYSGYTKGPASAHSQVPVGFKNQGSGQPWVVGQLDPGDVLIMDTQLCAATTENRRDGYFRASLDKRVLLTAAR